MKVLGRSGSLSPYTDMKSLYFDDSLYENEMHYKISKYLDELNQDSDKEEVLIKCDNEKEYNEILDKLYHAKHDNFKVFGVSNNPMDIIVNKDPRLKYRKFDEEAFLVNKEE